MLNAREKRFLDALTQLMAASAKVPTQQEIALAAGYKSKGSTSTALNGLEAKGYVKRDYRNAATIRLAPPATDAA